MPHAVDLDEEKQPFLEDDENEPHHHHSQLNLNKSQLSPHVNISGFSNGDLGSGHKSSSKSSAGGGGSKAELAAKAAHSLYVMKLASALFYAVASFLITVVNKVVLTSFK